VPGAAGRSERDAGVLTPLYRFSTASLERVVRCWHSKRLFFAIFFAIFLRPTEQICPDSAGPFIVSILLALLFSLFGGATSSTECQTRTKAALAAAKARGVKLGGPKLAEARKAAVERNVANANQHAANVLPVIREIKRSGASLHQIADVLNARGVATPRGGRWYAKSVSNVLARSA
jgi:hypothetical protein